ncbi:hypothetical protein BDB01DRAFT_909984 [Pilobolus umbonatus]|nr:hypothetical protein BDB01DRAFT_909984 [Pilobolus umbonatus]
MPKQTKPRKKVEVNPIKKKKPKSSALKSQNTDLVHQLDDMMTELNEQLKPKVIKIKKDRMEDDTKLEEEQRQYEKVQTDMDSTLDLLTKL